MTTIFEVIGWIGAILFCLCGVPQALRTYRTKSTTDISWWFLWMWYIGEILTLIYVMYTSISNEYWQASLLTNYIFNICIITYIIAMKWRYE